MAVSSKTLAGTVVLLFGAAMMGLAIHHVLATGTCSTTGYTRYGPAPTCPPSSTAWGIVLPIGLPLTIVGGMLSNGNIFGLLGSLFLAIGIGALTVGLEAFEIVFGGAFALAGGGLLLAPVVLWLRKRPRRRESAFGKADREPGPPLPKGIPQTAAAAVAGVGLAFLLALVFPKDKHDHVPARPPLANSFFQPMPLSPTATDSLFGQTAFARSLTIARYYIHTNGPVRSILLYPGGIDLNVADEPRGVVIHDISIDASGGYLRSDNTTLKAPSVTFPLSSVDPAMPAQLVRTGKFTIDQIDHFTVTPDSDHRPQWKVYPTGGGAPYVAPVD